MKRYRGKSIKNNEIQGGKLRRKERRWERMTMKTEVSKWERERKKQKHE
jgi:hypothetical protein